MTVDNNIFNQYAQTNPEAAGKIYDEVGHTDRFYFDCEASYHLRCKALTTGRSTNEKSGRKGQPFFAANFEVLGILKTGKGYESSLIRAGGTCDVHKWLPRDMNPENWPLKDKYNVAECYDIASALLGMQSSYMDMPTLGALCADDGKALQGKDLLCVVEATEADNKNKPGETITFYNAKWYVCDENGNVSTALTPEELGLA